MRVALIGRSEILYETAELLRKKGHDIVLVITAKEASEYTVTSEDFEVYAKKLNVPFLHTPDITEAIGLIEACKPIDIGVSLNYSGVIPISVTDLFPMGILNGHGGDLPRYRGNACQAWAILNGEEQVGLCIHRMVGGELDSGDIISRDYFPLDFKTKVTAIYQWIKKRVPALFVEALDQLKDNPQYVLEVQSKQTSDALRCYPRKPEDGRIDWNFSAESILRLINACNKPYAGGFCKFKDQQLIIWDAELAQKENFLAIPGQITSIGDGFVEVATGQGKLRITKVEMKDKVCTPDAFVKSIRSRFS